MEPIPETSEAINELYTLADDDLLAQLVAASDRVRAIVPDCIGMSVTILEHGVTFTLVASTAEIAVLDAIQYLAGGPCVRAVDDDAVVATDTATMDEEGWHLFADATAARGVASTLSMPLMTDGAVTGGVNLYGASRRAFQGHYDALAEILGAWAGGAVANADLSFRTRDVARRAPAVLREAAKVEVAVGMLAGLLKISVDESQDRLRRSAVRAGITEPILARTLTDLFHGRDS
jgi:GAF domain-containing protein